MSGGEREWKPRPRDGASSSAERILELSRETGLSPLTIQVCLQRGISNPERIQEFLSPQLKDLPRPESIVDMDRAVGKLAECRDRALPVWVFGDYDVDGTCGAALLGWFFSECGMERVLRQPDRFKDGYGLSIRAVEEAFGAGAGVLVTVDCGITSFPALERAKELGLDVIVVDHHQLDATRGLPPAHAVVNPQRPDCPSGLRELCGCGLAFFLALALRAEGRTRGWWPEGAEPNLKSHLDLVVIATAADLVPLVGANHALVKHGLRVLKTSLKPGVRALLEQSGISGKNLSPGHLGFVLGPRINASGRMTSASLALDLLLARDPAAAKHLSLEIEKLNAERMETQNRIWDEVRSRVDRGLSEGKFRSAVVVGDPGWHEGVVGIVASKVAETYRKPAVVISLREDLGKGSARSYAGKDVLEALRSCSGLLLGFGGHKHAAGLSLRPEDLDAFAAEFDRAAGELEQDRDLLPLYFESVCKLGDLDFKTLSELESLGPFGPGNPEPVFVIEATAQGMRKLKERHLRLRLREAGSEASFDAIWFHGAEKAELSSQQLSMQSMFWAGVPELNRYRGSVTPVFRVKDIKTEINSARF